jgi:hypothetical protein
MCLHLALRLPQSLLRLIHCFRRIFNHKSLVSRIRRINRSPFHTVVERKTTDKDTFDPRLAEEVGQIRHSDGGFAERWAEA